MRLLICSILAGSMLATPAAAYTECQKSVARIWVGDGGHVWLHYVGGGAGVLAPADPNREAVLALATTALTLGREIIVRYAEDGVDCAATRYDFVGMYLL